MISIHHSVKSLHQPVYFWNIIFYYQDLQRALTYAETCILSHKWSWSVFWCDLEVRARIKIGKNPKVTQNALPVQTPFPSSPVNQILFMVSYPGYLSWFQVSLRSAEKCGSCGGRNFGLPIDLAHRLYNSLLLPHKPWPTLSIITSYLQYLQY